MAITREQVIWVYRTLLLRDPESEAVIEENVRVHDDRIDMILQIINSEEFHLNYDAADH